jgi:hypothetical protein
VGRDAGWSALPAKASEIEFLGNSAAEVEKVADEWLSRRTDVKVLQRFAALDARPTLRDSDRHYWFAKIVYETMPKR